MIPKKKFCLVSDFHPTLDMMFTLGSLWMNRFYQLMKFIFNFPETYVVDLVCNNLFRLFIFYGCVMGFQLLWPQWEALSLGLRGLWIWCMLPDRLSCFSEPSTYILGSYPGEDTSWLAPLSMIDMMMENRTISTQYPN